MNIAAVEPCKIPPVCAIESFVDNFSCLDVCGSDLGQSSSFSISHLDIMGGRSRDSILANPSKPRKDKAIET